MYKFSLVKLFQCATFCRIFLNLCETFAQTSYKSHQKYSVLRKENMHNVKLPYLCEYLPIV